MARVGPGGGLGSLHVKSEPFFIHCATLHYPGGIFIYFFVCLFINLCNNKCFQAQFSSSEMQSTLLLAQ